LVRNVYLKPQYFISFLPHESAVLEICLFGDYLREETTARPTIEFSLLVVYLAQVLAAPWIDFVRLFLHFCNLLRLDLKLKVEKLFYALGIKLLVGRDEPSRCPSRIICLAALRINIWKMNTFIVIELRQTPIFSFFDFLSSVDQVGSWNYIRWNLPSQTVNQLLARGQLVVDTWTSLKQFIVVCVQFKLLDPLLYQRWTCHFVIRRICLFDRFNWSSAELYGSWLAPLV